MDRLEVTLKELRGFVGEREWEQFHDPKNLAMAISSEAGELLPDSPSLESGSPPRWLTSASPSCSSVIVLVWT